MLQWQWSLCAGFMKENVEQVSWKMAAKQVHRVFLSHSRRNRVIGAEKRKPRDRSNAHLATRQEATNKNTLVSCCPLLLPLPT